MNAGLLIIILLLGLALLGFPIYIALGIGALAALNLADLPLIVLPQRMFAGMNGSALLAIPFFILAGNIMSRSITGKLIDICNAIIGHIKGSLSLVTILASALFGAISGSGVAITIPAMKREGYPAPFAVGVASISSILGPIIPPSIVLIVYASITNVSVAELFLGSVLPGIILAVALIAYGLYYGHKHNLPAHEKPNLRKIGASVRKGIWALLMPIIIYGAIYGGFCTVTEAGAVSCVYGILYFAVLKIINKKKIQITFWRCCAIAGASTAVIGLLNAFSAVAGKVMTLAGISSFLSNLITANISSRWGFLLMINILFIFMGTFMDINATILIMTPLLLPVAQTYGISTIHFGAIMLVNMCVGFLTPPFAVGIFVSTKIAHSTFGETVKEAIPFMGVGLIAILVTTLCPQYINFFVNLLA